MMKIAASDMLSEDSEGMRTGKWQAGYLNTDLGYSANAEKRGERDLTDNSRHV